RTSSSASAPSLHATVASPAFASSRAIASRRLGSSSTSRTVGAPAEAGPNVYSRLIVPTPVHGDSLAKSALDATQSASFLPHDGPKRHSPTAALRRRGGAAVRGASEPPRAPRDVGGVARMSLRTMWAGPGGGPAGILRISEGGAGRNGAPRRSRLTQSYRPLARRMRTAGVMGAKTSWAND